MKKALLVGINRYKTAPLRGCVNDAKNLYGLLTNLFGFARDDVRVVFDERANKAGIIKRLKDLVSGAKAGDSLFFSYSGHGSQVRDRDGDEKLMDGVDEILCPYGIDFDRADTYITDDELYNIFSKLPEGVKLTVILDCCHSGTGIRNMKKFEGVTEIVSRYLEPPLDIAMRTLGREFKPKGIQAFSADRLFKADVTLWSGSRSNQTSSDANFGKEGYAGAFTHTFCKLIRAANGDVNRADLLDNVRQILDGYGFSQVPQLETKNAKGGVFS